ncbi:sialate O-acetylesterase [Tachyglossus aculeatus]|uniref:sialate O-acetylesterase n=1 Tax=Tachyglossus aculeatus TaxID=9261 RepID=UPI0018F5E813|nr:sialate O-acetylesterase [Tachyglossus aculeatus]
MAVAASSLLRLLLLLLLLLLTGPACTAGPGFRLALALGDHMVLQREPSSAVVWGLGQPGARVTVTLRRGPATIQTQEPRFPDPRGIWSVVLDPMGPGGPYELVAEQTVGANQTTRLTARDVYFGDVWLCGGQSNMEMTVSQIFNATEEQSEASAYPHVRIFAVSLSQAEQELEDLEAVDLPWSVPTPENLGHGNFQFFSAVCWLFGRQLYDRLRYPIGLVASSWGGTPIEAWSSPRALRECGLPQEGARARRPASAASAGPAASSVLWNAMIHPLLNMTLKGVIWYQGEANSVLNTDLYNCTFPALIRDWRRAFHRGSRAQTSPLFPFGFVQLSTMAEESRDVADGFPRIRWHQTADFGFAPNPQMPNTFMAVAMDLGDPDSPFGSIHPRDKQTVAYRLQLGARAVAYGEKGLLFQGPLPAKLQLCARQRLLNVTYGQDLRLVMRDDRIFEISCCGPPDPSGARLCKWVPAPMVSTPSPSSPRTLALSVSCPRAVSGLRYAWTTWPCAYKQCPLYHPQSALPAPPFTATLPH